MRVYQSADGDWVATDDQGYKARFATEGEACMATREQAFITAARSAAQSLWEALNTLETLQKEWFALDYGNTLDSGEGENAGITAAMVGSVVHDTANAMRAVMNAGHSTNVCKLL